MNDYLDIFNDVIRLATLQPRHRERHTSFPRFDEPRRERFVAAPRRVTRGF